MAERFINIQFPFKDSNKGYYLGMTKDNDSAIKSNLIHLLLTNKGERCYLPDFGANLKKILFEPRLTQANLDIRSEIQTAVGKYMPGLQISDVIVENSEDNDHAVIVRIEYVVTEGAFRKADFIVLEL